MDVDDSLGADGTDATQSMWEPPGYDADSSTASDPHAYDGYGDAGPGGTDGGTAQDGATGGAGDGADGGPAGGTMVVEVDGRTRELPAERDYTGDGKADAVVETADGKVIVFADTENNETGDGGPDGRADEAYVVDKATGQVVGAAHLDPDSGTWVEGTDADGPSAVGRTGEAGSGTEAAPTGGGAPAGGSTDPAPGGVVTVDHDGHEIGVQKTVDTDGDGVADSGILQVDGRTIVVTDTDGDPDAEQVALVDAATGTVTAVAHVDPRTGEWEEGPVPAPTGGAPAGDRMVVEVGGRIQEVPVERDYTGDGRPDAAVETKDGNVIVFADTENNETGAAGPDGKADEAWIVDKSTGQVVGAAHVDPRTGEWVDGADTDGPSSTPSTTSGQASS